MSPKKDNLLESRAKHISNTHQTSQSPFTVSFHSFSVQQDFFIFSNLWSLKA